MAEIRNAKDAKSFIAAWAGEPEYQRKRALRGAAISQLACASLAERNGRTQEGKRHREAARLLERAAS